MIPGPASIQPSVTEEDKEAGDLPVTDIEAIKYHQELEVYVESKDIMTVVDMKVDIGSNQVIIPMKWTRCYIIVTIILL